VIIFFVILAGNNRGAIAYRIINVCRKQLAYPGGITASDSILCVIVKQQQRALSDNNRGYCRCNSIPDAQKCTESKANRMVRLANIWQNICSRALREL